MTRSVPHIIVIENALEIGVPPPRVWPFLVDWENLDRWMKEGKNFRVTSDHREGEGVTAQATIKIAGLSTTDAIRVTTWAPPQVLEIEHLGWVSGTGRLRCLPKGDGTLVVWTECLIPPMGFAGALGLRILKPLMSSIFRRDLRLLKDLAESTS